MVRALAELSASAVMGHPASRRLLAPVYRKTARIAKTVTPLMLPVFLVFDVMTSLPVLLFLPLGESATMTALNLIKPFTEEVFYRRAAPRMYQIPYVKHLSAITFGCGHAWRNESSDELVGHQVLATIIAAYIYQSICTKPQRRLGDQCVASLHLEFDSYDVHFLLSYLYETVIKQMLGGDSSFNVVAINF